MRFVLICSSGSRTFSSLSSIHIHSTSPNRVLGSFIRSLPLFNHYFRGVFSFACVVFCFLFRCSPFIVWLYATNGSHVSRCPEVGVTLSHKHTHGGDGWWPPHHTLLIVAVCSDCDFIDQGSTRPSLWHHRASPLNEF